MAQNTANTEALVKEKKFNGMATYVVTGVDSLEGAKAAAERFWRQEYDTSPSKVVAEETGMGSEDRYTVMVADHSSGSLKGTRTIEL